MSEITVAYFNDFYDYNKYAAYIHELNAHWWQNPDGSPKELDKGERFMLMVSELAEAMEGDRKELKDDKLPQYPMLWVELADTVIRVMDSAPVYGWNLDCKIDTAVFLLKETKTIGADLLNIVDAVLALAHFEINRELDCESCANDASLYAAAIIHRCEKLANHCGCRDFWQVVHDKLVFNTQRPDHKWVNRLADGGKKY